MAAAIPLSPLFTSNQNTYFAHAVAAMSAGRLAGDWFVSTADPVPVFSLIVRLLLSTGGSAGIYIATVVCFTTYFFSLLAVVRRAAGIGRDRVATMTCIAAVIAALHAPVFNRFEININGVADQYLLGSFLQPSTFGVLLVAGVACLQRNRWMGAALAFGLAPLVHPTYLMTSGVFILTTAVVGTTLVRNGQSGTRRKVWPALAVYVCLMAVATAMALMEVGRSSSADLSAAQAILVDWRIPRHARVDVWAPQARTAVAVALVLLGSLFARDRFTRHLLAGVGLISAVLTVVALLTHFHALALLFPWRTSVVIVPIAASVLVARIIDGAARYWLHAATHRPSSRTPDSHRAGLAVGAVLVLLAVAGIRETARRFQSTDAADAEQALAADARRDSSRKVYLVPPLWENFRLAALSPIVVDVKSNPYRPADVIDWQRRVFTVVALFDAASTDCAAWERTMRQFGANAAIAPSGRLERCAAFRPERSLHGMTVSALAPR